VGVFLCAAGRGGARPRPRLTGCTRSEEDAMQYMLMIYFEPTEDPPSDNERAATRAEYDQLNATLSERGVLRGGAELQPADTATSVRIRNGKVLLTDGPFAETKEQLGGYYLIECDSLDEALEVAAQIPGARYGTIEVRPQFDGVRPSAT
jgi:hypothetical protein